MALLQSRDGYVWMTTRAGLVRFDGIRFRVFDRANTPGITSNAFSVFNLIEDRQGGLWAGTWSGGAVRYHDGKFTSYTTKDGLPNNAVVRIDEDSEGAIWIFTNPGLSKWKDGKLTRVAPAPGSPFNQYLTAPGAQLTPDAYFYGLWRIVSGRWERFALGKWSPLPLPREILDHPARLQMDRLMEDSSRRLWYRLAGQSREYYCAEEDRLLVYKGIPPECTVSFKDSGGHLWLYDKKGRTALWKDGRAERLSGFSTNSGFRALEDREGNFWIGTRNEGLYRRRRQVITVHRNPRGAGYNDMHPILQSRAGTVWVSGGGLTAYRSGQYQNYSLGQTLSNTLSALHEDNDGSIWVGTWDGIARFQNGRLFKEAELSRQIPARVNAIHRDRAGSLWFATERGLYRLHQGALEHRTSRDGMADGNVRVLLEDRAGTLWIGADGGLSNFTNGRFSTWTEKEGLSSDRIASLYEDSAGVLWVGTYDGGLNRLENGRFTRYTTENGLANNGVFQILEDGRGFFWISSLTGIYRVDKRELNDFAAGRVSLISSTHFGKQDGLLAVECSSQGHPTGFKARDGKLWFPTKEGVAVIDPEAAPINTMAPPVRIEDCVLEHRSIACGYALRFHPGQDNLELQYTALSFIKPEQIRFRYQMVGLDPDWISAGPRRTAYYTHLPPGNYVFRVTAANSDGIWNAQGASMPVIMLPPYYRTWWFATLIITALAAALSLAWRYRLSRLQRAHAVQQAFSRELIASQESERKRIAGELHDSLGQHLLIIKNWAMLALAALRESDTARESLSEISSTASLAIDEVRGIAYNLRPYQLEKLGLTTALRDLVQQVAASSTIRFSTEIAPVDGIFPKEVEISIYRIIQESLNNTIRHSQATEARVLVTNGAGLMKLTIKDNGRGFTPPDVGAPGQRQKGFGLLGITERVRMLGGQLVIQSTPGRGSDISILLKTQEGGR